MDKISLTKAINKSLLFSKFSSQDTLSSEVMKIKGMSGLRFRQFLNHLLRAAGSNTRYLEIGTHTGSTAIAALYQNIDKIEQHWLVDNWSQFGGDSDVPQGACLGPRYGVRNQFLKNFTDNIESQPNIIEEDCFKFNPECYDISDVNIYFYDGDHSEDAHFLSLKYLYPYLANTFIFIVDDWGYYNARHGTKRAIEDLKLNVDFFYEKIYPPPLLREDRDGWWNGCGIYVLSK